jgi:hypothetical protein
LHELQFFNFCKLVRPSLAWRAFSFSLGLDQLGFIRTVILSVESAFFGLLEIGPAAAFVALIVYFLMVHVGSYAWQLTGLVRACDRYQSAYGSVVVT